jgi:hypothetical protein
MKELGPEAHALLEAARGGDEPTDADEERVRAAITTRLLAGAAGGLAMVGVVKSSVAVAGASGGGTSAAAAVSLGFAAKVVIIAVLVGTIGMGVTAAVRSRSRPLAHAVARAAAPSPTSLELPVLTGETSQGASNPRPAVSEGQTLPVRVGASAVGAFVRAELPPGAPPPSEVAAEVHLLREAHLAMGAGDVDRALVLLDEHERRYPRGALGEERDATRIGALCALGRRVEAKDAAERFLRMTPRSLQAAAVRASCGGSPATVP